MEAGVGSADFTPGVGTLLQGHGDGVRAVGVLAPLESRAIVFTHGRMRLAIVTLDAIGLDAASVRRIRTAIFARCGIEPDRVLIAASHTHWGPALLNFLGTPADQPCLAAAERAAVAAVVEAAQRTESVRLALGAASACFPINRRPLPGHRNMEPNPSQIADRRVRLLRVDRPDGTLLAVLFHFSCHPTTGCGANVVSPDYPGLARAQIEHEMCCRALFIPGCFGNVRPAIVDDEGQFKSASEADLRHSAGQLARAVCGAAEALRTRGYDELAAATVPVRLEYAPLIDEASLIERYHHYGNSYSPIRRAWENARQCQERGDLPTGVDSQVQALRVGPMILVGLPGEAVQEIGLEIEKRLWESGGVREVWACGYCNDMLGYLVTEAQKREGGCGYEQNAYFTYGRPAPFQHEQQRLVEAAVRANAALDQGER